MERTIRRTALTAHRRALRSGLAALLCAAVFAACAGGSGSSGFDAALKQENEAIDRALASNGCETNAGLTICASNGSPAPAPSPSVTATAFFPRTATPALTGTVGPIDTTATPTPSPASATATLTPTATSTPGTPAVETNLGDATDSIPCREIDAGGACFFLFQFQPENLPPESVYRVAVRTQNPSSAWSIEPVMDNSALIAIDPDGPEYQLAVLVYLQDPGVVPDTVELLADSGADLAFVTPVLTPEMLLAGYRTGVLADARCGNWGFGIRG